MKEGAHICFTVMKNCINPDSYGEICVGCNACGRFDKATQKESALRLYEKLLQDQYSFDDWDDNPEWRKTQEKNIASNIKYFTDKIKALKNQD